MAIWDISMEKLRKQTSLTKYAVGAKPKPPKNPRRSPKKGKVIPKINVKAVTYQQTLVTYQDLSGIK